MVHLRLLVPLHLVTTVVAHLHRTHGVAHVVRVPQVDATPGGELVLCDVAREAANDVVEWLQDRGVHHEGAIVVETIEAVVSDAAEHAEAAAPGHAADALVWEELEAKVRSETTVTASYLIFILVSAIIAAAAILLDSPILMVGAMAVGPEYGPLAALCVALAQRRSRPATRASVTLLVGLAAATVGALVSTILFRWTGLASDVYELSARELTAFISRPDGLSVVVAVLAGIVGMLSLTEARSGAMVGVLISVTTIPAAANVGVALAYGEWSEVRGAAVQLAVNLIGLVVAGTATLLVQSRATGAGPRP